MEKSIEEKYAELQKENEALKSENTKLSEAISSDVRAIPIKGKYKKGAKNYSFADGHINLRLANGTIVPCEQFLQLANGKAVTLDDLAMYPGLRELADPTGKALKAAKDYMMHLIEISYGYLKEV